jgi:hypothetical protein
MEKGQTMNFLEQYFKAIYSDFQAKVGILAELVRDHPGEYGGIIENAVAELLRNLLPDAFSIGTGFVIDSEGHRSRQSDIVIYDSLSSFDLFGYGGRFLFPVECVYATVEVKKTLDKSTVDQACQNIASIKQLRTKAPSVCKWVKAEDGTMEFREHYPTPPRGIIIAYQSNTQNLATIRGWFEEAFKHLPDANLHPDLSVSILEGFKMRYSATSHNADSLEFKFYPLPWRDSEGNVLHDTDGGPSVVGRLKSDVGKDQIDDIGNLDSFNYNRRCKLVSHPNKPEMYNLADDARLLMTTLGSIARLLSMKAHTDIVLEEYFSPYFAEALAIPSPIHS